MQELARAFSSGLNRGLVMKKILWMLSTFLFLFVSAGLWTRGDAQQVVDHHSQAKEFYNQGCDLGEQGNFKDAITAFSKAIGLEPRPLTYYNRGYSYGELGDQIQAIKDYDMAIKLNPNYERAYASRGMAYGELGNPNQAVKDFDKAIQLNPKFTQAYFGRGLAYAQLGDQQQAVKDFSKTIELDPKNADVYYLRSQAFSKLKNHEAYMKDLHTAADLGQKDAVSELNWKPVNPPSGEEGRVLTDGEVAHLGEKQNGVIYEDDGKHYCRIQHVVVKEGKLDSDYVALTGHIRRFDVNGQLQNEFNGTLWIDGKKRVFIIMDTDTGTSYVSPDAIRSSFRK